MQFLTKRWVQVTILVAIVAPGYFWLNGVFRAAPRAGSTQQVSPSVPAPNSDQKKVVLKNLGMT